MPGGNRLTRPRPRAPSARREGERTVAALSRVICPQREVLRTSLLAVLGLVETAWLLRRGVQS